MCVNLEVLRKLCKKLHCFEEKFTQLTQRQISTLDACSSIDFIRYFELCQETKSRIYHYMQQAETKLVGNHRLDRHEMPSPYNYKFPFDQNLQTAGREENRSKKLIIMNSDIVGTFLSYRTK